MVGGGWVLWRLKQLDPTWLTLARVLDPVTGKSCWACTHVCLKSREDSEGEGMAVWSSPLGEEGWFLTFSLSCSLSLSLSPSGELTCPITTTTITTKPSKINTTPEPAMIGHIESTQKPNERVPSDQS